MIHTEVLLVTALFLSMLGNVGLIFAMWERKDKPHPLPDLPPSPKYLNWETERHAELMLSAVLAAVNAKNDLLADIWRDQQEANLRLAVIEAKQDTILRSNTALMAELGRETVKAEKDALLGLCDSISKLPHTKQEGCQNWKPVNRPPSRASVPKKGKKHGGKR
jgi:hypothetical protein